MRTRIRSIFVLILAAAALMPAPRAAAQDFTRQEDVVYGRKYGVALTMDVFKPKEKPNGAGVVYCVSGGWFSSHESISPIFANEFTKRGYTVFAVVHGSQPKFTIPEILQDMNRALRFIRYNAAKYGIDPNRIGITGGSAGGHLSLMQGCAGDAGSPTAADPVDRVSSRVQAVACFFPPTDFLNYGQPGRNPFSPGKPDAMYKPFRPAFDFHEINKDENLFERVTDQAKALEIVKAISPITHVTPDDPPTLIIHGDKDTLVPLQQSQVMVDKLKAAGVTAELVVAPGFGHDVRLIVQDLPKVADWFDKYLKAATATGR